MQHGQHILDHFFFGAEIVAVYNYYFTVIHLANEFNQLKTKSGQPIFVRDDDLLDPSG